MQKCEEKEYVEFNLRDILPVAMIIVVTGIVIAYGLQVLSDVRSDMTASTAEYNATSQTLTAVAKFPTKLGLVVTVVLAAIVIGILVRYLAPRFM